jgi:hypothetical protein
VGRVSGLEREGESAGVVCGNGRVTGVGMEWVGIREGEGYEGSGRKGTGKGKAAEEGGETGKIYGCFFFLIL